MKLFHRHELYTQNFRQHPEKTPLDIVKTTVPNKTSGKISTTGYTDRLLHSFISGLKKISLSLNHLLPQI